MKTHRNCPICSCEDAQRLYRQVFKTPKDFILPDNYQVVACDGCGFVYADVKASQKVYNNYYREISKYEAVSATTNWDKGKLPPLEKYLDKDSLILDIGCANGELLEKLKEKGFRKLAGIDLSSGCLENVENKGFRSYCGNFINIHLSLNFDGVILSHVFEHIYDLREAVRSLRRLVVDNGIAYVEVPDASRYADYHIAPYHYFDFEHINHFDEYSLIRIMAIGDFEPLEIIKKESFVGDHKYPAVGVVFRKRESSHLAYKVRDYIAKSKNHDIRSWPDFRRLSRTKEPVVVWGVGAYTMALLSRKLLKKCNIRFFIDRDKNKDGWELKGLPVYSNPKRLKEFKGPIIVSSAIYEEEIVNQIIDLGLENEIITRRK